MAINNRLIFIFFLLFGTLAHSQKTYEFDYVSEYQTTSKDSTFNQYHFINSKDNSFMLVVWQRGNETMMKLILDEGKFYFGTIITEDFFVEAISLQCPRTGYKKEYENLKNFDFIKKNDTVINTKRFGHFIFNPTHKKDIKKHKMYPIHYLMDNEKQFTKPMTSPHELIYRKWEKGENIPNGIIQECYTIKPEGKQTYIELLQCIPVKKIIIVDNNCK